LLSFRLVMRGYPVYRMDTSTDTILRVGTMLEFRKSRRSMNRISLAKLAQKLFSVEPGDVIYLGSESALGRADIVRNREDSLIAG
jgi:hypothetical protein